MNDNAYELTSPVVTWTEAEAYRLRVVSSATTPPVAVKNSVQLPPIIILLEEGQRAIDIFHEAAKETVSRHPLVRAVIDGDLGFITIFKPRPQDDVEERILIVTPRSDMPGVWTDKAFRIAFLPGVKSSALQLQRLHY